MARSSSEIRSNITRLEGEKATQQTRLTTVRQVKSFLETAYISQVNAINAEIGYLYENLLEGILNGIGAANTLQSKHTLVNDYVQSQSSDDSYLSKAINSMATEESNTKEKISSLQTNINSEWTAYHDAVEREEEERRRANNLQLS